MSSQHHQPLALNDINSLRRASIVNLAPFLPSSNTQQNIPSLEYVYQQQQQYQQRQQLLTLQTQGVQVVTTSTSVNTPQSVTTPQTPSTLAANSLSEMHISDPSTANLAIQQQQVQFQMQQQLRQQINTKQQQQEKQLKTMYQQIEHQLKKIHSLQRRLKKESPEGVEEDTEAHEPPDTIQMPTSNVQMGLLLDTANLSEELNRGDSNSQDIFGQQTLLHLDNRQLMLEHQQMQHTNQPRQTHFYFVEPTQNPQAFYSPTTPTTDFNLGPNQRQIQQMDMYNRQQQQAYQQQSYPNVPYQQQPQQQQPAQQAPKQPSSVVHSFVNETTVEMKSFELLTEELEKQKQQQIQQKIAQNPQLSPTSAESERTLVCRGPIKRKNNRPKEYDKLMTKFILK
jgi:hypothetical protein